MLSQALHIKVYVPGTVSKPYYHYPSTWQQKLASKGLSIYFVASQRPDIVYISIKIRVFSMSQVTHHIEMRGLQLLLMKKERSLIIARLCVWIQRALITAGTAAPLPRIPGIDWPSGGGGRKGCRHTHCAVPTRRHTPNI